MNQANRNLQMEKAFLKIAINQNDLNHIAIQKKRVEKAESKIPIIDDFEALMNEEWDKFIHGRLN